VLETGDAAMVNADEHYPMQSVYKLPIAMAMMDQVRLGQHDLDEVIGVTKEDFVREGQRSPLRDNNPNGGEFTIRELIRLALVESDGSASDVLLRVLGSPADVQSYLTQIGVRDMKVINTEKEIGRDWQTQYENWATPVAAVELLRWFDAGVRTETSSDRVDQKDGTPDIGLVRQLLIDSAPGPNRLKGLLPEDAVVAHKTGTGGVQNGVNSATNDIGIIDLPNGNHLGIAVFVSDSAVDEKTRETVIAKVAKAAWDFWNIPQTFHGSSTQDRIDMRINGVGLGNTDVQIEKALGKAHRSAISIIDICGKANQQMFNYSGLRFQLTSGSMDAFSVLSLEIFSAHWAFADNVRIGDDRIEVLSKLGKPKFTNNEEPGLEGLGYYTTSGDNAILYFAANRLIKVRAFVEPC
jgi:beta-lactamase class A